MELGLIEVYTGDGKGKTTAAIGSATRALGQGLRVGFFQFLKTGMSGEMIPLVKAGAVFMAPQGNGKFVYAMNEEEKAECKEQQMANLLRATEMMPKLDVLVLDEIFGALETGMVEKEALLALLAQKPQGTELVLTGRNAPEDIVEMADYVTEMRCIKHPYNEGISARVGIEF